MKFLQKILQNISTPNLSDLWHSLAKSSHDAPRSTYRFVPVVDFNEEWTDEKLYNKYNLNQDEIDLIESSIKTMD